MRERDRDRGFIITDCINQSACSNQVVLLTKSRQVFISAGLKLYFYGVDPSPRQFTMCGILSPGLRQCTPIHVPTLPNTPNHPYIPYNHKPNHYLSNQSHLDPFNHPHNHYLGQPPKIALLTICTPLKQNKGCTLSDG